MGSFPETYIDPKSLKFKNILGTFSVSNVNASNDNVQ